jgi:hypothetical protein
LSRNFFTGNALDFTTFNLRDAASNFALPQLFNIAVYAAMSLHQNTVHEFSDNIGRKLARLFNNLIKCHRHAGSYARLPSGSIRSLPAHWAQNQVNSPERAIDNQPPTTDN